MSTLRILALTACVASAFSSASALAGDDPKYPAYDFKPTIIIPAAGGSASASAAAPVDSRYPAANFVPRVIYLDPALAK